MTDRQKFKTKPVIPDPNLFYRRVKFLCIHSSFAGEQNIDLQMSHGAAVRLKKIWQNCLTRQFTFCRCVKNKPKIPCLPRVLLIKNSVLISD